MPSKIAKYIQHYELSPSKNNRPRPSAKPSGNQELSRWDHSLAHCRIHLQETALVFKSSTNTVNVLLDELLVVQVGSNLAKLH